MDWNSEESQELRFEQLLRVVDTEHGTFTINDFGSGYGALLEYLDRRGIKATYRGFDVSGSMIDYARRQHQDPPRVIFVDRFEQLEAADYTVASGIFNVKLDVSDKDWREYALRTLEAIARLSTRGFAFNMLTNYSDTERMRPDLYYGDPAFFFDHVKRRYARNVALLHDYGLYEFTILARFDG